MVIHMECRSGLRDATAMFVGQGTVVLGESGPMPISMMGPGETIFGARRERLHALWVEHVRFDETDLWREPLLAPLRISAGALGPGFPDNDVVLALGQWLRLPGSEKSVPAEHLVGREGVALARDMENVAYTRAIFTRPGAFWANGLYCEGFRPDSARLAETEPKLWAELVPVLMEIG
ncbi:Hint domain-containing protein [Algicella marina]|nr:Hint domain-containing protein [Algicella marina]